MEKKEKKGFWASLFSPKPCKCARGEEFSIRNTDKHEAVAAGSSHPIEGIKEIKVLGPGCAKCKSTCAVVEKVVKASGMDITLSKVDDIEQIMSYNIMTTPAIVVDGTVVMKGKVPSESEVRQLLGL